MFDHTKPYRTQDGRRVWCAESPEPFGGKLQARYAGWVEYSGGLKGSCIWDSQGAAIFEDSDCDLVNAVEERVGWLNVYPNRSGDYVHASREQADTCATRGRIACVEIRYKVEESAK